MLTWRPRPARRSRQIPALNRKVLASLLFVTLGAASLVLIGCDSRGAAAAADLRATGPDLPVPEELDRADLDALFERMDENGADVRSGHLVMITRSTYRNPARGSRTDEVKEEMWFQGGRVRFERRKATPRGRLGTEIFVFDGRRLTTIRKHPGGSVRANVFETLDLDQVACHRGFGVGDRLMRWPLNAVALGVPPHRSRLGWRRQRLPRLIGEEQVGGLRCVRLVLLPKSDDRYMAMHESLWVAPTRGHAVARFEHHDIVNVADRTRTYGLVWQAEEWLHPTEGLWLPSVVVHRRYEQLDAPGVLSGFIESRAEIVSSEFNVPIPEDVFRIEIPPDAEVPPERPSGRPPLGSGG